LCEDHNMLNDLLLNKKELVKLYIIMKFINIYTNLIHGFIDDQGRAILNNMPLMNANVIYAVDKEFQTFICTVHRWWTVPFIDMNYKKPG